MKTPVGMAALAITLVACGGGSPTAAPTPPPVPTPTPPPVLSFADGWTDAALTPATVTPASPRVGDSVAVEMPGYWRREQVWRGDRVQLWPVAGSSESAYKQLVYGEAGEPLVKWASMRQTAVMATVAPEWESAVPSVKEMLRGLFAGIEQAGGPSFSFQDAPYGNLTVRIDPENECIQGDPNYVACARWWQDGSTITRAELIFRDSRWATNPTVALHSLGHLVGLHDWSQRGTAMGNNAAELTPLEQCAVHMMYQHRNPGNLPPDRDPSVPAATGRARLVQVAH